MHAQQDIDGVVRGGCGPPPAPPGFDALMERLREVFAGFPDRRKGKNKRYSMLDAALGAFAVFVAPQDGHVKQDCEIAASKRWLDESADLYREEGVHGKYFRAQ